MNCFSVDVEGFIESNLESIAGAKSQIDESRGNREIATNVRATLDLLAEFEVRGTFFILGRIARDIPDVVRAVAAAGHEIGCHGFTHRRIFGQTPDEFRSQLTEAKKRLEDVSGSRVVGFRAPDFSITQSSLWALDILREVGFAYDSSVYAIGLHDVYGIKDAQPWIHRLPNGLVEFPLATVDLLGRRLPFGGGGYFRLYPLWLTQHFTRKLKGAGRPCMFYIHPYEVGPEIPRLRGLSAYRRFRHYYHCGDRGRRLRPFLRAFCFAKASEILMSRAIQEQERRPSAGRP